jgi:hypothetical protein
VKTFVEAKHSCVKAERIRLGEWACPAAAGKKKLIYFLSQFNLLQLIDQFYSR